MDYSVTKDLLLTFVVPKPTDSFKNHERWFQCCIERFNEKSDQSTVNRKKIMILDIGDEEIRIRLHSEINLGKAPGRALTMLSRMLITKEEAYEKQYDPFFAQNLFHGKLFTISPINDEPVEGITIADSEVLKALVDYLTTPKSLMPESKKRAFEEIKRIAIESKIIDKK